MAVVPKTISLLNMKGGVGKTTLAVNLAWYMHQGEDLNVLLVDLDPQFNATQYVMDFSQFDAHRKAKGTIADLLLDQPRLDLRTRKVKANPKTALYNIQKSGSKRFDLLPAELDLAWVVKNPAQMEFKLERLLAQMRSEYDYVFIDCAPTDSVLTTMALSASDFLLVPMRPDRFSVLGYLNLLTTIQTFRKNCEDAHHVKDLGVVFTQVTRNSSIEQDAMDEVRAIASKEGGYIFTANFKYSPSFMRAVQNQTPIFQTLYAKPQSRHSASNVADEMKTRIGVLSKT